MKSITMTSRLSMNGAPLRAFFLAGLVLTAAAVCSAQVTFTEYPVPTAGSSPHTSPPGPTAICGSQSSQDTGLAEPPPPA